MSNRALAGVLGAVAAVAVIALAITIPMLVGDDDSSRSGSTEGEEAGGEFAFPGFGTDGADGAPSSTDLSEVVVAEGLPTTHVSMPTTYETVPPMGGPHFSIWMECGVYTEPIRNENAVHDLEHGTVWITYDSESDEVDEEDIAALASVLPANGILSPYPGQPAPVMVTVWERQLALSGADDPRLPLFLEEFSGGVTAPEPFASCAGGLTDPAGGVSR